MSDQNFNVTAANSPSTPTGGDTSVQTPATATPVAPPSTGAASVPTPTQPTATVGAPTVPPGYIPSFRLRETRDQYEARLKESETKYTSEIETLKRQVQALAGVSPQGPANETDAIREQLFKVVPDLKTLIELKEQLAEVAQQRQEWQQQNNHYWQSYNRTQMDRLFKAASDSYGQPLTDPQKRYLAASFVGWASADPELKERYQTDPSLIDDFWGEFKSSFIEPARRIATTGATARVAANLPQDTPTGGLRTSAPPEQPKDLDSRVDNAWQAFKQMRAEKV